MIQDLVIKTLADKCNLEVSLKTKVFIYCWNLVRNTHASMYSVTHPRFVSALCILKLELAKMYVFRAMSSIPLQTIRNIEKFSITLRK